MCKIEWKWKCRKCGMVINTTELSDINDDLSSSKVMLCDKTWADRIDLRSEADTSVSDDTRKSYTGG